MSKIAVFWFRRDLRLEDNVGLHAALKGELPVLPLFIFDSNILDALQDRDDRRVEFIHHHLTEMQQTLHESGSSLLVVHGKPLEVWQNLLAEFDIAAVYTNHDYEPYATKRDEAVQELLESKGVSFQTYKDQVIFEKTEILSGQDKPYTVYTPYKNKWRSLLMGEHIRSHPSEEVENFLPVKSFEIPSLESMGFVATGQEFPSADLREELVRTYHDTRNIPSIEGTTRLSVHLRFGTISIRRLVRRALELNETWLDELIWREFFMMILWNFPQVVDQPFKEKYSDIPWRNNEREFQAWCDGKTGYPIVDAGMRELNETGFMHNRVRMITASFLVKHLLVDWRKGERYFARKLLDFELSANNGNWQWSAGCGCDAAPYFRVFNPYTQVKKFDPELKYIKKWVPELNSLDYPNAIVEHKFARERVLKTYKDALESYVG